MTERTCTATKNCPANGVPQDISQFRLFPITGKYTKTCASCRNRLAIHQATWTNLHPEEAQRKRKEWKDNNVEYVREHSRLYKSMRPTEVKKAEWVAEQDKRAKMSTTERRAYLDHKNMLDRASRQRKRNA